MSFTLFPTFSGKKFFALTLLLAGLTFTSCQTQNNSPAPKPTNVILMIGDGMGLSQLSSIYFGDTQTVHFDRMTTAGLVKTWSAKEKVTDSASSATAYATGQKSFNRAIGVGVDSTALETLVERVHPQGISTGLIATSSITHATPASFYAHVPNRGMNEEIAKQLTMSNVDFFAGGGLQFFADRRDGENYYDMLGNHGIQADSTGLIAADELDANNRYGFLLANDGLKKILEGRGSFLPDAADLALNYFTKKEAPFFMMIEGSQIDWGGHANDYEYLSTEVVDFNETLGRVLDFAEKDGNTLVLLTADHETGGFTLAAGESYDEINPSFSTGGHSATLVPVLAFGPGAENFSGIMDNTDIHARILDVSGW